MEQAIAAVFLALFGGASGDSDLQTPPAIVQSAPGQGHAGGGTGGHGGAVPMNSPEPITMLALAGGAAAAGGLSRRRKKAAQKDV